ncbi:MAG: AI-2E family transporter [Myxococcota bacterium]
MASDSGPEASDATTGPPGPPSGAPVGIILVRVVAASGLLAAAYIVLQPFLVATIWAAILAYVTWPLFVRVRDLTGQPTLTAAVFTLVLLLALGLPAVGLLVSVVQQATNLVASTREWLEAGAQLPEVITGIGGLGPRIEAFREEVLAGSVGFDFVRLGQRLSSSLGVVAGKLAGNAFSFLITLLALFAFYTNGEQATHRARALAATIFPGARASLIDDIGSVVRATVFGLVGTALVQGAVAAAGFLLFDVPYALALGALVSVLSFIPGGPVVVWGTATLWLIGQGQTGAAVGNALWGALVVGSIDNVLRPVLIRRSGSVEIPFLLVFFGVLGGLSAFGLLGLFVGPVILSVVFALLSQMSAGDTAEPDSVEPEPSP